MGVAYGRYLHGGGLEVPTSVNVNYKMPKVKFVRMMVKQDRSAFPTLYIPYCPKLFK